MHTTTGSSRTDRTCDRRLPSGSPGTAPWRWPEHGIDDVAHVDLYSCFPCAVQIAAHELGLPLDDPGRSLTVTGGLGFAGGPGNNYVSHSIAAMAQRLRADPGALGLVTGLGWYSTKHAVGLWSTTPPEGGFRHACPQDAVDTLPRRTPAPDYEGDATIETYTVVHDRDGAPELAIVALLTEDGRRAWGNISDRDDMVGLMHHEGCNRKVRLAADGGPSSNEPAPRWALPRPGATG